MIRKYFNGLKTSEKDNIRWRSHEPKRIEAFSDAVFAFAISLLVFSLEVPKTSEELLQGLQYFIPFIFCFGSIFYIWFEQYKFFRRYGMNDLWTILLNGALIFVVLFYVYPLKFLFSEWIINGGKNIRVADIVPLILVYNGGLSGIYLLFLFMYINAYVKREELNLSPVEVFETRTHIYTHLIPASIGLFVALFALMAGKYAAVAMAGWGFMGVMGVPGSVRNKAYKKKFGSTPKVEPQIGEE